MNRTKTEVMFDLNTAAVLLLDAQRSVAQGDTEGAKRLIRSTRSALEKLNT